MKMKSCYIILLYFGLTCCQKIYAESEHNVKRGMYPFMAFIYYSDPSVEDSTGQRFIRSAVLIRPDWLITSALGSSSDSDNGFPKKTLLARAGAVTIDSNFTLNEDEDEQEREIVQIVRPRNHSATQWWATDISLMKTLLPFNMTSAVAVKPLNGNQEIDGKTCSILVYMKYENTTEDKSLIMLYVDILPPSMDNCGHHFLSGTMTCASDSEENKKIVYDSNFCHGNRGGPLICENEIIGLQTYIDNNCNQPHLYQLLRAWDNFITCGIEDKCQEEHCGSICEVNYKDPPITKQRIDSNQTTVINTEKPSDASEYSGPKEVILVASTSDIITKTSISEIEYSSLRNGPTVTMLAIDESLTPETTLATTEPTTATKSTETSTDIEQSQTVYMRADTEPSTEEELDVTRLEEPKMKAWPKVKQVSNNLKENDTINPGMDVEAHQQLRQKKNSALNSHTCVVHSIFIYLMILLCMLVV